MPKSRTLNAGAKSRSTTPRLVARLLAVGLAAIITLVVQASFRIRNANSVEQVYSLEAAEPPSSGRLLVVAPHPDDETLACAGIIQSTLARGGEVKVVYLTNGCAFRIAAERKMKKLRLSGDALQHFGDERQEEAIAAARTLGLSKDDLCFLGFPDRGLAALWTTNWSKPYRSPHTDVSSCPFKRTWKKNLPYTGHDMLQALADIVDDFDPEAVYVSHPSDDHPDHYAAYAFLTAALAKVKEEHPERDTPSVNTYLVHRGQWPVPKKQAEEHYLTPPAAMSHERGWRALHLTEDAVNAKEAAIRCYKSQTAVMGPFLRRFARRNELFCMAPASAFVPARQHIQIDGRTDDWAGVKAQIVDPAKDTVGRALRPGLDIKQVLIAQGREFIYVRVDTAKTLPRSAKLNVLLRSVDGDESRAVHLHWSPKKKLVPAGIRYAWRGPVFEAAIPASRLNTRGSLWVGAGTHYLGFGVDKTGWRPLSLDQPRKQLAAKEPSRREAAVHTQP